MLSKICSPIWGVPKLIIVFILKQIHKRLFELAAKQQIDGEFGDGDRRFGLLVRGVTAINVSVKLID